MSTSMSAGIDSLSCFTTVFLLISLNYNLVMTDEPTHTAFKKEFHQARQKINCASEHVPQQSIIDK